MDHPQDHNKSRKRSRSPARNTDDSRNVGKKRSRSPGRKRKHHKRDRSPKAKLPFKSHHLHRNDFDEYNALFAEYLGLQKGKDIHQVDDDEVKGRWKSFLNKWNRGELAEGWYDPETKVRADGRYEEGDSRTVVRKAVKKRTISTERPPEEHEEDEDDGYGPALPDAPSIRQNGPVGPSLQDIQQRNEQAEEDRDARIADLRYERKQDRQAQKERLEDLVPRAQAGTRERQIEKKRDTAASNRTFAAAKEAGAEEVGDNDLMGDDVDNYKAKKRAEEKQKNEREIRKEEVLRARAAEREEKMQEHRRKEAKTMDMLKAIAQQRFGGGDG